MPTSTIPVRVPRIDISKDSIVIWVPGTNSHKIPKGFSDALPDFFTDGYSLVKSDYLASWDLVHSIPNGVETLKAILDEIRRRKRASTSVFLAGESQGSLVISEVLSDPKYYDLIKGAALLGMPGIANNQFKTDPKVAQINNFLDPVTISWRTNDKERVIEAVSHFMTGDVLKGIGYLVRVGLRNLDNAVWLGVTNLHKVPLLSFLPSFHSYDEKALRKAVLHLWLTDEKSSHKARKV